MRHEARLEQRRLRRRIRARVFTVVGVVAALVLILSVPELQQLWFPAWLIKIWGRVVAAVVVVALTALLLLPVVIEANLNSRRLSGPGRLPSTYHRSPWDEP